MKKHLFLAIGLFFLSNVKVNAQKNSTKFSEEYFSAVKWRNIGPFRGGRSARKKENCLLERRLAQKHY